MTSCVHKMCRQTYGQTNMKRATTLAKINHPWNQYNMFVWPYVRLHILCTQLVICLLSHFIHICYLGWPWSEHAHIIPNQIWIKCKKRQMTSCVHKMCRQTYGQTNMKRATTFAKINHPWNRYNMRMLRSWAIKIIFGILVGRDQSMGILYRFHGWLIFARVIALFMFVCPYVHLHILCTQLVICLLSHFIHVCYLGWPKYE
jgi:hypothetical protein